MNYQGSKSGCDKSLCGVPIATAAEPSRRGQPGSHRLGQRQSKCIPWYWAVCSCSSHTARPCKRENSKRVHSSNQLLRMKDLSGKTHWARCAHRYFQSSSGSTYNSYFQSAFTQTMLSQTTRKSVITQIGTYFSYNWNITSNHELLDIKVKIECRQRSPRYLGLTFQGTSFTGHSCVLRHASWDQRLWHWRKYSCQPILQTTLLPLPCPHSSQPCKKLCVWMMF